jgi:ribosome maturation factor RimP
MAQNTAQNMADNSVVTAITALVSPILRDLSLELYDCEYAGGVLKVTIDTPPGSEAGVDLEQLALVTRLLGRELDHDDNDVIIPGKYTLEVTSPGLERTLRTPAHFQREAGKVVSVRLTQPIADQRRFQGVLLSASETHASLRRDDTNETVEIPLHLIDKARTVFVWGPQPKPNSPEARAARRGAPRSNSEVNAT